jgi:hypothetical protein
MRKNKTKEQFWYALGSINVITMAYPIGTYLRANSMEDQILAVSVLGGGSSAARDCRHGQHRGQLFGLICAWVVGRRLKPPVRKRVASTGSELGLLDPEVARD